MTPTTLTARPLARLRPAESAQRSWRYALTGVVALFALALVGCAPRPAIVMCRNTGTRFDAPGGVKTWVSVNYSIEHAAFHAFRDPSTWVGVTTLPTGFCNVEWLP